MAESIAASDHIKRVADINNSSIEGGDGLDVEEPLSNNIAEGLSNEPREQSFPAKSEADTLNTAMSPLLRLPAELRAHIFEYVLSNKTIHIGIWKRQMGEPGGFPLDEGRPINVLHALCSCDRSWDEAYRMSKAPESDVEETYDDHGFLKLTRSHDANILKSHYVDHKACNSVLNDFQWRDFMSMPVKECCCPFPCIHYFEYRAAMIEQYGKPPAGISAKHIGTKYDLALLQTCKLIHKETAMLPYTTNTFAFQERMAMNFFLDKVLTTSQRDAIQCINVCMRSLASPTLPEIIPVGLKVLQCFVINHDVDFSIKFEPWRNRFERVEAISGWDGKRSIYEWPRSVRKERAKNLEDFLSKTLP